MTSGAKGRYRPPFKNRHAPIAGKACSCGFNVDVDLSIEIDPIVKMEMEDYLRLMPVEDRRLVTEYLFQEHEVQI